ncbi:type I methionyl aminopeptidase [Albibacterium indicum]|uniref:type I methionyl aminopeptidase n=1 Tax=Albibacterium indicum TaxID=2292082 RepID=UPI000E4F7833|nr:type I methionyl aminopeptidase [Pedobacter indicus]
MSKVILKSKEQIELIRKSCDLLSKTLGELAKNIQPGIRTIKLDDIAREFIYDHGAKPAFLNYNGFPYSLCISVNDQVVHGFPGEYVLKEGDIISVDGGVVLEGYVSDSAYTFGVGEISEEVESLLRITKESLYIGIDQAVVGKRVGDISYSIQNHIEKYGYGIVKELVGHGVGVNLHEKPEIPNYGRRGNGIKLVEGMVVAIEPMVNLRKAGVKFWDDGWTVSTIDGMPSAHFEHTVAISKGRPEILTTFSYIEDILSKKH